MITPVERVLLLPCMFMKYCDPVYTCGLVNMNIHPYDLINIHYMNMHTYDLMSIQYMNIRKLYMM